MACQLFSDMPQDSYHCDVWGSNFFQIPAPCRSACTWQLARCHIARDRSLSRHAAYCHNTNGRVYSNMTNIGWIPTMESAARTHQKVRIPDSDSNRYHQTQNLCNKLSISFHPHCSNADSSAYNRKGKYFVSHCSVIRQKLADLLPISHDFPTTGIKLFRLWLIRWKLSAHTPIHRRIMSLCQISARTHLNFLGCWLNSVHLRLEPRTLFPDDRIRQYKVPYLTEWCRS